MMNNKGSVIAICGKSGAGYTVKLCNQILCAVHLVAENLVAELDGVARFSATR